MQRCFTLIDHSDPMCYAGFHKPYNYLDPEMYEIKTRLDAVEKIYRSMLKAKNLLITKMEYGGYGILVGQAHSKDFPWKNNIRPVYAIIHNNALVLAVQEVNYFKIVLPDTATGAVPEKLLTIWQHLNATEHSPAACGGIGLELSRWNSIWFDFQFGVSEYDHHQAGYQCADVLSEFMDPFDIGVAPSDIGVRFEVDNTKTRIGRSVWKYTPLRSTEPIDLKMSYVTSIVPGRHPDICFIQSSGIDRLILANIHCGSHLDPTQNHVGYGAQLVGLAMFHGIFPKELTPDDHFNLSIRSETSDILPGSRIDFDLRHNRPKIRGNFIKRG